MTEFKHDKYTRKAMVMVRNGESFSLCWGWGVCSLQRNACM